MELVKDQIVEGVITGITTFGAFVKIGDSVTGLVHISEISNEYVRDIKDLYAIGDTVKVLVLKLEEGGKLVLSIKKAEAPGSRPPRPERPVRGGFEPRAGNPRGPRTDVPEGPLTFEDKLARFLKQSEEIQHDAKRSLDLSKKRKKKN